MTINRRRLKSVEVPAVYQGVCKIVEQRIGVQIQPRRGRIPIDEFVAGRLVALGLNDVSEYVSLLSAARIQDDEFSLLIGSVTNPHTFFYRDVAQLEALMRFLKRRQDERGRRLNVWSAGCSTGEEVYSLAMLMSVYGIDAYVLGSDVNRNSLQRAQLAQYQDWSLRHMPHAHRSRFFAVVNDGNVIKKSIQNVVDFRFHNLLNPTFPQPNVDFWDVILCRNVFIYFARSTVENVVQGFSRVLYPEGRFVISSTENMHGLDVPFSAAATEYTSIYAQSMERKLPLASFSTTPTGTITAVMRSEGSDPIPLRIARATGQSPDRIDIRTYTNDLNSPEALKKGKLTNLAAVLQLLKDNKLEEAISGLKDLLSADQQNLVAQVTLGNIYALKHEFQKAVDAYAKATDLDPLIPEVHFFLGRIRRKLGDFERAETALRYALFLRPSFWQASFLLAGIHARRGNKKKQQLYVESTLSAIKGGQSTPLHASFSHGFKQNDLNEAEVQRFCEKQLAELT